MTAQPNVASEPSTWKIQYSDHDNLDNLMIVVLKQREALRSQQRGINRLRRRIDKMRHLELENAQLRKQVKQQKEAIAILSNA